MATTDLNIIPYRHRTTGPPSAAAPGLLNSIFMYTVNTAAKTLVSVAETSKLQNPNNRWKTRDHLRFMVMLMTWVTIWVLRILMDHLPLATSAASFSSYNHQFPLDGFSFLGLNSLTSLASLAGYSSVALSSSSSSSSSSSLDMVMYDGGHGPAVKALGRALAQILAILNEIPATSRKYQFAMTMADRIMDQNACEEHPELLEVNKTALSSALVRTSNLLYDSLQSIQSQYDSGTWTTQAISALPLGSYVAPYVKGLSMCFNMVLSWVETGTSRLQGRREVAGDSGESGEVMAEKFGQELLWITNKLRVYGAGNEALVQWSYCSGLASLSLNASPRVQGLILKISAILFGDLSRKSNDEVGTEVKYRLLLLWLPLFCHANNGLAYPILSAFEKLEIEATINSMISALPASDQEVVLTIWIENYTVSSSDWPNLQLSYDRWCHSVRQCVT